MPAEQRELLVLRLIRYGEHSAVVHALEPEWGRLSLFVRSIGPGRNRISPALFFPLNPLRVSFDAKGRDLKQQLPTLRGAELLYRYEQMYERPHRMGVAVFLAEWFDKAVGEQGSIREMFRFLNAALEAFDRSEGCALFPHWVLVRAAGFLGYAIEVAPEPGLDFDRSSGQWRRRGMTHQEEGMEISALLSALVSADFDEMSQLDSSSELRAKLIDFLVSFHREHLPGMAELKSLDVLRALWA
jgi:recombinational DNA repair protein (RecF pathway)